MNLLREYIRSLLTEEQSMNNEEKVIMLFFKESYRMGAQMAEMTPGLESLAEDFDDLRASVTEFIGHVEGLVKDRRGEHHLVMDLCKEIDYEAYRMVRQLSSQEPNRAVGKWSDELCDIAASAKTAYSWPSHWSPEDQAKLDDLKDWARES